MDCWLRWPINGAAIALARPLARAVVEDALCASDDRLPGRGAPELSPPAAALLEEARRRASLKRGRPVEGGDVALRGGSLYAFLQEHLVPGTCPDARPVDDAAMRPLPAEDFVVVARCGAWKDARIQREFDARFGAGRWRMGYSWGARSLDVRSGVELYEDGYRAALAARPELRAWVRGFADVYDTAPSNVAAYCDYSIQEVEGAGQHWQDVAVRRALLRLGEWFHGDGLLEIRGQESGGYRLNPGQLEFHEPARLVEPRQYAWWRRDSIEDFSVSNFCVEAHLPDVLAWMRAAPIDADRCATVLVAQHPGLLPELPRVCAAGARATLFAARALTLMGAAELLAGHDDPQLFALVERVGRLAPRQQQLVDRLLADDPLTRKEAFPELLEAPEKEFVRWLLEFVLEDPARKLRARAREELAR
ncbi:MAG: hypothetical protein H6713_40470 [Myxococcales bacterium]|nr:hypothetical protein [Myxococcales bacterium]